MKKTPNEFFSLKTYNLFVYTGPPNFLGARDWFCGGWFWGFFCGLRWGGMVLHTAWIPCMYTCRSPALANRRDLILRPSVLYIIKRSELFLQKIKMQDHEILHFGMGCWRNLLDKVCTVVAVVKNGMFAVIHLWSLALAVTYCTIKC